MVRHVLERASAIEGIDEVIAAIPDLPQDDPLADVVADAGFVVSRGSADDVLSRYATAAASSAAETVVRLTADCPLLSPRVSRRVLEAFIECDYASNTITRTYPRGLDTEVMTFAALESAHREAAKPSEREHVTPFIWRNPDRFRLRHVTAEPDRSNLRWTVDTAEDMAFATAVYDELGSGFEVGDVLDLLERKPKLGELNRGAVQKPVE